MPIYLGQESFSLSYRCEQGFTNKKKKNPVSSELLNLVCFIQLPQTMSLNFENDYIHCLLPYASQVRTFSPNYYLKQIF